ncbi:hypothetical protein [Alkalicoccus luteus]|uniref:Uncharacterized protein n=1 Tax=Alkalicoccus luteus TaxID=1237094 RepID=A0A969PPT8_9BACI|nr:hypothetical protein [Alkalicoccus luteus]NJP37198.1 hypothetical protein [Alkalicoccus luteus]
MRGANRVLANAIKRLADAEQPSNHRKYYRVTSAYEFIIYLEIADGVFSGFRFQKDANDDFIKMREQSVFNYGSGTMQKRFDLTENTSNKEFAISVREVGGTDTVWLPEHNNTGTVFESSEGVRSLIIDGQDVSLTSTTNLLMFDNGHLYQHLFGYYPGINEPLTEIKQTLIFQHDQVKQRFGMRLLKDTHIGSVYAFMLPMRSDFLSHVATNKREIVEADTENLGTDSQLDDLTAFEYYAVSKDTNKRDFYLTAKIENASSELLQLFLQHRDNPSALQKFYPYFHRQEDFNSGVRFFYDGYYKVGYTKNADKVFS